MVLNQININIYIMKIIKFQEYLKENELTKEFNLSEIVFQIKNDNEIIKKNSIKLIKISV